MNICKDWIITFILLLAAFSVVLRQNNKNNNKIYATSMYILVEALGMVINEMLRQNNEHDIWLEDLIISYA